jgi:hypothetical protein
MPRLLLVGAVLAVIMGAGSVRAQADEGPWCAILNFGSDVTEDCQYRSLEQCLPAITGGFRGFCNPNPRWRGETDPRAPRRHPARQR